ncbi:MAG: 23S rRNA (guanosine(2251)-2'-O)-methyltransferase RlmB [bacterium]
MERHNRGKGKKRLLGSHQKCWIWGRNPVVETLAAGRWEILDLYLSRLLKPEQLEQAQALAVRQRLTVVMAEPDELTKLCHSSEHQGYLARMTDFPYADEAAVMAALPASPFCVILDGIQDPYNFGAIIRSAEIFGANAVFIADSGQVGVTSMVVRSSAGAVNRLPIVRVAELAVLIDRLKAKGIRVVAASEKAACNIVDYNFTQGVAIVIGNEGVGPGGELLQRCNEVVKIPQAGHIGSLNAAVAAGIFFYEIRRQRQD